MSLLERVEDGTAAREIEPGKRLIRAGDDRGLSLFERLNLRFQRFAWKTPMYRLRLRGRMPLKLIAVPKDPIAGDKATGEALLRLKFALPDDVHELRRSLDLADSLLSGEPRSQREASSLAPLAAVRGRCTQAVSLARRGATARQSPFAVAQPLAGEAAALGVHTAMGCPQRPESPTLRTVVRPTGPVGGKSN